MLCMDGLLVKLSHRTHRIQLFFKCNTDCYMFTERKYVEKWILLWNCQMFLNRKKHSSHTTDDRWIDGWLVGWMARWMDGRVDIIQWTRWFHWNSIVYLFAHASPFHTLLNIPNTNFPTTVLNTTVATICDIWHSMCHCACRRTHGIQCRRYDDKSGANQMKLERLYKCVGFDLLTHHTYNSLYAQRFEQEYYANTDRFSISLSS